MAANKGQGASASAVEQKAKAATAAGVPSDEGLASPLDLQFDPINPRMPLMKFKDDAETIKFMIDTHDVDELVRAIMASGWLDYEPLIVERPTNYVLEGNRRLAALKLLSSEKLRAETGYKLPDIAGPKAMPQKVRVRFVPDRKTARSFIGFKCQWASEMGCLCESPLCGRLVGRSRFARRRQQSVRR
ncbi:ParB N-terminal domain-containing protein [Mesorhizobium sp. B2-8-9]|uniref:ParB N-terminal domain-containing protein n=1 Tax=Mesorhizobium sp. B2-8-9 TaxID=2589899 RepID=UPI00112AA1A0|nr:ParB N-terminal domain-containing protein [Mesorhizobium sp. B2-8-9]TPI80441.1 hypothetical protein FJ423_12160 [Mesorhizobium sp. B2-8-9]